MYNNVFAMKKKIDIDECHDILVELRSTLIAIPEIKEDIKSIKASVAGIEKITAVHGEKLSEQEKEIEETNRRIDGLAGKLWGIAAGTILALIAGIIGFFMKR